MMNDDYSDLTEAESAQLKSTLIKLAYQGVQKNTNHISLAMDMSTDPTKILKADIVFNIVDKEIG